MPAVCPSCGRETPAASRYCPSCGTFLAPAASSGLGPAPLARKEATLRPVTVLFCDIKDSTELISQLHSEVALKVLSAATDGMAAAVRAAGGTVLKWMGDGVMAVFGVPVAQPDHALRACRAGLDIIGMVAAAFADDPVMARYQPQVRIGLNSGEVAYSLEHPSNGHAELDVFGDQVSLAARVESAAKPDAVYMTEATYLRVRGAVAADYVGSRLLHGFSKPVALYRLWAMTSPILPAASEQLCFVGRSQEMAELRHFVTRLREGRGGVLFIFGEPGIGKTRLLEELRQDAVSRNLLWLRAGSPPLSENVAYWAAGEQLRALMKLKAPHGTSPDWEALCGVIEEILGDDNTELDPGEATAFLARVLRIDVAEPWKARVESLDADATYRQTLRVWWRLLDALAAKGPVVLEFDDLQWVDPASASIVSHVLPLVRERPIAIMGCGRSDDEGPTGRLVSAAREVAGMQYAEMRLHALVAADTKELLARALGGNAESVAVRRLVFNKAEGNPFFVEEIIRTLKQMDLLVRGPDGQWVLTCPVEQIQLPESLQELILARVDRLDEGMREVVRVAAVIGRQFLHRVLAAVSERSLDLDEKVKALQRQDLIDCMHQFPELKYIFKHAVVQETIYASLFEERRRNIHRMVADCLEGLFPEELEEFFSLLAYHSVRAEDWAKAQHYLFLAADQAHRLAADEDALRSFQEALAILDRVVGHKLAPLEIAAIRRKLGSIHYRKGDLETAQAQYVEGLRQLGLRTPRSQFGVHVQIGLELVRHVGARLWRRGRVPSHVAVPERASEVFPLFEGLAWTYYHQDQKRLLLALLRGLNFAEQAGSLEGIAKGSSAFAYVLNTLGAFQLAAHYQERSLTCARAADSAVCMGLAENVIGLHHFYQGCLEQANAHYDEAQRQSRLACDWFAWTSVRMQSALVALVYGDAPSAFAIAGEMISHGREAALAPALSWGHLARGRSLQLMGYGEDGRHDVLQAIGRASSTLDYQCLVHAKGILALMLIENGEYDAARRHAVEAAVLVKQRRLVGHHTTDTFIALALIGTYRLEQAVGKERAALVRDVRRSCRASISRARRFLPALPAALRVAGTVEWLTERPNGAVRAWTESARLAETIGARNELAATLREHGMRVEDVSLQRRAEVVLASLPSPSVELAVNRGGVSAELRV